MWAGTGMTYPGGTSSSCWPGPIRESSSGLCQLDWSKSHPWSPLHAYSTEPTSRYSIDLLSCHRKKWSTRHRCSATKSWYGINEHFEMSHALRSGIDIGAIVFCISWGRVSALERQSGHLTDGISARRNAVPPRIHPQMNHYGHRQLLNWIWIVWFSCRLPRES